MRRRRLILGSLGAALIAGGAALGVAWERARVVREPARAKPVPAATKDGAAVARGGSAPKAIAKRTPEAAVHECNICGYEGPFTPLQSRPDASCPRCKSRERHRLLMHFFQHKTPLFTDKLEVLHFTPMKGEADRLRELPNLKYVTAEYEAGKADLQLDLTALAQPDASWDVLIVYHILEHITEDRKAMAEMYRVLRPGGVVYLQVPLEIGQNEIYEDPTIVTPEARKKAFHQWDHVRLYSAAGLRARLEEAGFVVEAVDYLAQLSAAEIDRFSMHCKASREHDESIWVARKPKAEVPPKTDEKAKAKGKRKGETPGRV